MARLEGVAGLDAAFVESLDDLRLIGSADGAEVQVVYPHHIPRRHLPLGGAVLVVHGLDATAYPEAPVSVLEALPDYVSQRVGQSVVVASGDVCEVVGVGEPQAA